LTFEHSRLFRLQKVLRPDQRAQPSDGRFDGRGRDLNFLPSEFATVGLVLWGAQRFYFECALPGSIWAYSLITWVLVAITTSVLRPQGGGIRGSALAGLAGSAGVVLIALIVKGLGDHLDWSQAAAVGIVLGVSIAFNRWLLSIAVNRGPVAPAEGLRWAALQGLAAYAIHPYVRCAQVGAGDAYHYSLTLADFIRQVRSGIFPVLIGQSEFAFNGGIHSVRTAPYYAHLGGLLDALTLHTLPFYAVSNLAVAASATLAVVGAYTAMRLYAPARAVAAMVLSALFILSPAILAPLYEGDMIATFMAVPMLPWWVLGLALAADDPLPLRPWLLQGSALAVMWLAHPPMAAWATALTAAAWVPILARSRNLWASAERVTLAALTCALLASYEFVSVLALKLPSAPGPHSGVPIAIVENVVRNWKAGLMPLSADGNLLGDIQLGYSLTLAAFAGFLAIGSRKSASLLLGCMAALLILLVPVPVVTPVLWSWVPHAVLVITNVWPMQRFYPILAALAAFAALSGASHVILRDERRGALIALAVVAALGWSLSEAQILFSRREATTLSNEASKRLFRPENIMLTRVSYLFFGSYPGYFSHSMMEPFLETRLLDSSTLAVLADGSTTMSGGHPPGTYEVELRQGPGGEIEPEIPINPAETLVFRFDFRGRDLAGVLQLSGRTLSREYRLPWSGEGKSFGSGLKNGRVLAVQNTNDIRDSVRMDFVPDPGEGAASGTSRTFATLEVEPFTGVKHVIELRSLLPFRATVVARGPAILETPRVDVPGYRARVNGRQVEILRTSDGLVGVPVAAGTSDVTVDYPGSAVLRLAYGACAGAWIVFALCVVGSPVADPLGEWLRSWNAPLLERSRSLRRLPLIAFAGIVLALCAGSAWNWWKSTNRGAIRLVVSLPAGSSNGSEPLVTTGRPGAGDTVFLNYLGGNRVSVGHDWWGHPAAVSGAFTVDFMIPQTIEISMESLVRRRPWTPDGSRAGRSGISVKWNGREILSDERGSYPAGPDKAEIGTNGIGATTCAAAFTGKILESEPIDPWTR